ncbi:MAG: DbpA RNA binding domain-containing protein, partial [Ilumatobacteraceae bacterium]
EQRLLGNIERLTKQQISLETVPTVADLRAQRIAQTIEAIRTSLASDDLDEYQEIVAALSGEHDTFRIALAAAKLAHDAESPADDDSFEIPDARRFDRKDSGPRKDKPRAGGGKDRDSGSFDDRSRDNSEPTGYLYISMGRKAGMRPGDLVGAIANEVGLEGRQIGPIRITDNYSVVGIPDRSVDEAVKVLNGSAIRGKPTKVRRYTS